MSCIIENFHPIELKGIDCYRSALAQILAYYNVDYRLLFLQRDTYLKYGDKIDSEQYGLFSLNEFLFDVGISLCTSVIEGQDSASTIKLAINNKTPTIAFFDSYYDDTFPAIHNQTHSRHACPIYGYDDKNFFLIGNNYVGNFERVEKTMSLETVSDCIHGYEKFNDEIPSIQIFVKTHEQAKDYFCKYINKFFDFYKYHDKDISAHLNSLSRYVDYLKDYCFEEQNLYRLTCQSFIAFNDLVKYRTSEYYGLQAIFRNVDDLLRIDEDIVERGNYVRSMFYHIFNTKEIRFEMLEKAIYKINEMICLEKSRFDYFLHESPFAIRYN